MRASRKPVSAVGPTRRTALVLALLLLGLARGGPQARAAGGAGDGQASAGRSPTVQAADQKGDAPSAAMLEFLGSFSTADGHWLDPMALASPAAGGASSSAGDSAANDQTGNPQDKSQVDRASERHEQHD